MVVTKVTWTPSPQVLEQGAQGDQGAQPSPPSASLPRLLTPSPCSPWSPPRLPTPPSTPSTCQPPSARIKGRRQPATRTWGWWYDHLQWGEIFNCIFRTQRKKGWKLSEWLKHMELLDPLADFFAFITRIQVNLDICWPQVTIIIHLYGCGDNALMIPDNNTWDEIIWNGSVLRIESAITGF